MNQIDGNARFSVVMEDCEISKLEIIGKGDEIIKLFIMLMYTDENIKSLFFTAVYNYEEAINETIKNLN